MAHHQHQVPSFLTKAAELLPKLKETLQDPLSAIEVSPDESAPLGWKASQSAVGLDREMKEGDEMIVDFGGHRVGTISFDLIGVGVNNQLPDAPARIKFTFGEILNDVIESFEPYQGKISKAWLPTETITYDFLPLQAKVPRRWAFRYVKIEVIATSMNFNVRFDNLRAVALTSAPLQDPPALSFPGRWSSLSDDDKSMLLKIDAVSHQTLRDCMQTVYEDGPRRDMRCWIGDLRLQAIASYATFRDFQLAKRCLYLFAGVPFANGKVPAGMFEKPVPTRSGNGIYDYAILYSCSLLEYVQASGDDETGRELYPTALKQFDFLLELVDKDDLYFAPMDSDFESMDQERWNFIDWEPTLEKSIAMHSVLIYCLRRLVLLESHLGLPPSTHSLASSPASRLSPSAVIDRLVTSARSKFFSEEQGVFVGPSGQVSWASQAWAVLADIPSSQEQARACLERCYSSYSSVTAVTPYLHHYLLDAFIHVGLDNLAVEHLKKYWGSMIEAGFTSFPEAWDPKQPRFSPYGDLHVNSFCHAWSCTPSYLLRLLGMQ